MSARRIAALALTGALVAGGTGAAIAAVSDDHGKKAEGAILDNAAKRLDVTPDKLRDALAAAEDDQLDHAVMDGKLTQHQADAINDRRRQSGRVLGGPGGLRGLHRGCGRRGGRAHFGGAVFPSLAGALGISNAQLRSQLRDGKSIADIAKAQNKLLDDVRASLKSDARTRLDKAVADGDLTRAQADRMLDHVDDMLEHLDEAPRLRRQAVQTPGGARFTVVLPLCGRFGD
ncbi:MAG: hypothetical protein LC713_04565 [Actinobacteria bacterium]|nr:hypothetical protein [Actinomycetota bacterium]